MGGKRQSIKTEPEVVQILDLADKDCKVAFMCYRNKLSKELKRNVIVMSEQIESFSREMESK